MHIAKFRSKHGAAARDVIPDLVRVAVWVLSAAVWLGGAASTARAQPASAPTPEISTEAALSDLRILQRAFVALHPGLYRYATPPEIDAAFAAAQAEVAGGSTRAAMVLLASRLAAAVRCGHTWVSPYNQSPAVATEVFGRADKLPLTLRWIEGRVLVTGSTDPGVPAGSELLAIDDRPVAEIAQALLPYLRADGNGPDAEGKRLSQLDSGPNGGVMDRLYPLRFPPDASADGRRYRLRLRDGPAKAPRTVAVAATSLASRERALPAPAPAWQLTVDGDTAVMTLPTFAFWGGDFKPQEWLARSFEAVRNVPYLIIDQRRNEGGDDATGQALTRHLLRTPLQLPGSRTEGAYERAPYALARYLDTWDYGFFDRTGQARKGPGRNWLLPPSQAQVLEPMPTPYAGRVILLVGPQNSSAGHLLARDLKASGAATLIGQPTGGNLRGLNGGQVAWVTLPASGVGVDIPLLAHFETGNPPDAGVAPDVRSAPSWTDALAGVDTEMATARALVARWKAGGPGRPVPSLQ
jgi:hypothetical protein